MSKKICTLLFLQKDDAILLAMKKRGFGAGFYNGVGGKVEPGETIEQALVRECQEEIGVTPLDYRQVAELDFTQNEGETPWHMYVHAFLCDRWSGKPLETEEMAPVWMPIADIPYDKMWESDAQWLPGVLNGQLLHGAFTFDKDDAFIGGNARLVDHLPLAAKA